MIDIIPNWHPILVHFTVGLLATSVAFYVLSILPVNDALKTNWRIVARWCLWTGMLITLATLTAGYLAYNSVAHDAPSHAAMTTHRNWAFATAGVFAILTLWSIFSRLKKRAPSLLFVFSAVIAGGLLATTGWLGGEAVYRYGLGVMSMPESNGEGHAHEHPEGGGHDAQAPAGDGNGDTGQMDQQQTGSDGHAHEHNEPTTGQQEKVNEAVSKPVYKTGKTGKTGNAAHDSQPHTH